MVSRSLSLAFLVAIACGSSPQRADEAPASKDSAPPADAFAREWAAAQEHAVGELCACADKACRDEVLLKHEPARQELLAKYGLSQDSYGEHLERTAPREVRKSIAANDMRLLACIRDESSVTPPDLPE